MILLVFGLVRCIIRLIRNPSRVKNQDLSLLQDGNLEIRQKPLETEQYIITKMNERTL